MSFLGRLADVLGRGLVRAGATLMSGSRESGEQLLSVVDDATEQEAFDDETQELVHQVFEFGETLVREVMVPRPDMLTVSAGTPVAEAVAVLLDRGVSRVPVTGEDIYDVVGVLHLKDVVRADQAATVQALMREAVFIPEFVRADDLLKRMQRERFHLALVVDEYGGIAGLVTLEDLIEELVGEIADEHDREAPELVELGEGRYRFSARYNIEDLGEVFGIELDDDEVDSVGGLLTKALGRLPVAGASAETNGLRLTAERVEGRRLRTVIVERDAALAAVEDAFPPVEPGGRAASKARAETKETAR